MKATAYMDAKRPDVAYDHDWPLGHQQKKKKGSAPRRREKNDTHYGSLRLKCERRWKQERYLRQPHQFRAMLMTIKETIDVP